MLVFSSLCLALPAQASEKVQELADPSLPDIATVRFIPGQAPLIVYNPLLCRHAGPALCEFYRYHEYGHIAMHHDERTELSIQEKEEEADRWAALHAPLKSVVAAYQFFASGHGGTPHHGESSSRAERLENRAKHVALVQSN